MTAAAGSTAPDAFAIRAVVADDDAIAREIVSRTLARWQFDVATADDGLKAWDLLGQSSGPVLGIVDWTMPRVDGLALCRRMRDERPLANVYLILLTARESRAEVIAGLDAGADDYMVKPFDPDELRARVNVGVRVLSLRHRLDERVAELQEALASVKQLRGLLPICSYCKRIRGDDRYWQAVESYLTQHTEAEFSHGICPSCFEAAMNGIPEKR